MSDDYEVRPRGRDDTGRFFDREQARRRRRGPGLEEIAPAEVAARLETTGSRGRLASVRVTAAGYSWRWPWSTLEHVDVVTCDLEGVQIASRLLRASRLDDCRFEKVAMGGARIGGTTFTDCVFDTVSLVGTATSDVRGTTFRGGTFSRLDARSVIFDRVTFEDCHIDGLRGQATIFKRCSFARTTIRGPVSGIVLDGCSFDRVDMSEARLSRAFIVDSRVQREFVFPAQRSGFAIDYQAYRVVVEEVARSLSDADGAILRTEAGWWATNPPAELLIDEETFNDLSIDGRAKATNAMFEHRLVRRG